MARMILIRLDGQMSLLAKCNEGGWVHSGIGKGTLWSDCCAEAGNIVCHSSVDCPAIGVDGCPKAGDFTCHSSVGVLVIKADDSCPEAGDFRLWTWGLSVHCWMRMHAHCVALLPTELWAVLS